METPPLALKLKHVVDFNFIMIMNEEIAFAILPQETVGLVVLLAEKNPAGDVTPPERNRECGTPIAIISLASFPPFPLSPSRSPLKSL